MASADKWNGLGPKWHMTGPFGMLLHNQQVASTMSENKPQACGRPVYTSAVPPPSEVHVPLEFEQIEHCAHPDGPQLHEIRVNDAADCIVSSQVRYDWLQKFAATVCARDWILVSIGQGDSIDTLTMATVETSTSPSGRVVVRQSSQLEADYDTLGDLEFEWLHSFRSKPVSPSTRLGDFQSLVDCLAHCPESYLANSRFTFEFDFSDEQCDFLKRFFENKSPHAARLLYIANMWRCVIYGDGTIHSLYLAVYNNRERLEAHFGAELNQYTDDDWMQLHQMLYQKHWCVTASLNEWQMSVGCPLSMSAPQRIARITDLAARAGVELSDAVAITFAQVAAFLPFKEIHDLYMRYVIAFAPLQLAALPMQKILALVSEEFLAMPDHVATRLIENVRRVYQYREALFEQFDSGVSANAWRVQPARGAKRKALLGIEIDRNECKLLARQRK